MAARLLFLIFTVVVAVSGQGSPVVRVSGGLLSGGWAVSANGRSYAAFRSVPYARPPVGKYRFREPQRLKNWPGTWDATRHLPSCLQYDPSLGITGSENCLYLNVYTPQLNAGVALPVLVFIHGGAFMYGGSSLYDPSFLMDRDIVVVTMNYRLGPLGFLSTGDEAIPGNAGLKDQAFALRWVRENIMMFGGNPDSVTLAGCSAGGASVHYHYLSPLSRGNFARGIAFSGSAFSSWTHAVKPAQKARALATLVGCPSASSRDLADCLRYRPAEAIVQAQVDMFDWGVHMFTPFTPTVEGPGVREPFLSQYPYHAAQAGQMNTVPLLTSVTTEEGLYPAAAYQSDSKLLPELEARWEDLASIIFEYNDTLPVTQKATVASKIKQRYLAGKPVSQETFGQLVQALGDRLFVVDVGRMARMHAQRSGQPVYLYRFGFRGDQSLSTLMSGLDKDFGVSHADDIFHIFKFPGVEFSSVADMKMVQALLDMVYAFSTTGVPKFGDSRWTPVQPGSPDLNFLDIKSADKAEMNSSTDFGHKSFWESLGFIENENYRSNLKDEL